MKLIKKLSEQLKKTAANAKTADGFRIGSQLFRQHPRELRRLVVLIGFVIFDF